MNRNETKAANDGREIGAAAALWTLDGNTDDRAVAVVCKMFADGDPAVYDVFSGPSLSGEWAGESISEISGRGDWSPTDDACTAWEDAASDAFWSRVEALYAAAYRDAMADAVDRAENEWLTR